jgi:hypothetical protein
LPFDLTAIGLGEIEKDNLYGIDPSTLVGFTRFGIPGQHLIFSQPVKVMLPVQ